MPEIRQDPATKEWVIIATDRARRPEDFARPEKKKKLPRHSSKCPFCPGNEHMTPDEIYSNRDSDGNWTLRIVPNKFPALVSDGSPFREEKLDFFRHVSGIGQHEVIIESPNHNDSFGTIDDDKAFEIVAAYHLRYNELRKDKRLKLVKIFRNHGVEAGTSLEHPHSQIVATPVVPLHIRHQLEEATRFYDNHGECVFCRLIDMELKEKSRVVTKEHGFLVIEPFASRMPFETWIVPLEHHATFGEIDAMELKGFAQVLNSTVKRFKKGLNDPAYNMIIRTAPIGEEGEDYYHWHAQIIPRLTTPAGFELGTGVYINTALPERSAAFLRNIDID